jgi:outer membrane protein assembly factor BamB
MAEPSLTTLIRIAGGADIQGYDKWSSFVDGGDGFLYGIPCNARRVVKFDPLDKSLTEIGPDLGGGGAKWKCGVLANTGSIYCAPYRAEHILKIDTIQGTVETLDNVRLPETGDWGLWESGALAGDNHIYYMPASARRIMRLNPDNDSLSSVGDDLGEGEYKYSGTVVGNDKCLYGIPLEARRIAKFDPTNPATTSTVGEEVDLYEGFDCGNGVLAGDGYIYAVNESGQVLKVDTTNGNYIWIGDPIYSENGMEWGDPIIGADQCIYWPPQNANRVLKFDTETQQLPSRVGDDLGEGDMKWQGGALATDGVIYCVPYDSSRVLTIDPFKELSMTLQNNFTQHPQELGRLFAMDEECDETFFESSLRKFDIDKVFELIEECLPLDVEWTDTHSNALPLFMVAASCENCAASVIYYLLRRNVHALLANYTYEDSTSIQSKKRKLGSN